jgi:hypothetical protein
MTQAPAGWKFDRASNGDSITISGPGCICCIVVAYPSAPRVIPESILYALVSDILAAAAHTAAPAADRAVSELKTLLLPVIQWLEAKCDPLKAAEELRLLANRAATLPADRAELVEHTKHVIGDCIASGSREAIARANLAIDAMARSTDAPSEPIDMVLYCPACGVQHVDAPDKVSEATPVLYADAWTNPPHRSHLCHGCGHVWRPADVATNGVAAVKTTGKADSPLAAPPAAATAITKDWCVNAAQGELESGVEEIGAGMPATSTPCASGEAHALAEEVKTAWGRQDPKRLYTALDKLERLAATQAPAVPATTEPKSAGYFKHDAKRGWTQVNPADWILPGVVPLYFADSRTPTASNTEDARCMGAVSERTPMDFALEHAEYLAKGAERLVEAINEEFAARQRLEEDDDQERDSDITALNVDHDAAVERMSEAIRSVQLGVHGFRTRRDRAALTQAASTGGAAS